MLCTWTCMHLCTNPVQVLATVCQVSTAGLHLSRTFAYDPLILSAQGDACTYSHGVYECWLHPAKYRTQLCKDGAQCCRPVCFFAHSVSELRSPTYTWENGEVGNSCCNAGFATHTQSTRLGAAHTDAFKLGVKPHQLLFIYSTCTA